MPNVYITIEESYPTYLIGKDKINGVLVKPSKDQLARWKQVEQDYNRTQKEIENLVNYYEPIAATAPTKKKTKPLAWR